MSLNTFWRNKAPFKREVPLAWSDTFHAYLTAYIVYPDEESDRNYDHQVVFGELKLCENINFRRAPIPTHHVAQVKYREPYAHCEKCMTDIAWLRKMEFGEIVELR